MPKTKLFSVSIHDCIVEEIASTGGGGGQNKNRRHTAIRITHPPSGAKGYSADQRDQLANKRTAFRRMAETDAFGKWVKLEACRLNTGKTIEQLVDEDMSPENLKVEVRTPEGWTELA